MNYPNSFGIKRFAIGLALGLSILSSLAACAPGVTAKATAPQAQTAKPLHAITIQVDENGFQVPDGLQAGITDITIQNKGKTVHSAVLVRLRDGISQEEFQQALTQGPDAALPKVYLVREGEVEPGASAHEIYRLKAGDYFALDMNGEKPAVLPFHVAVNNGESAPEPVADVKAQLVDFAFILPDQITAGRHTWMIENKGSQWHELAIVKPHPGVTVDDMLASLAAQDQQGEPPVDIIAMWPPMSEEGQVWVELDLPPGEYTVVCTLPDSKDGKPHMMHGMVRTLKVVE